MNQLVRFVQNRKCMLGALCVAALATIGMALGYSAAPVVTEFSCKYEIARRGTSGWLTLVLHDDAVKKIDFFNFYKGLPDRPGYSCHLEISRSDNKIKWSNEADKIEIDIAEKPDDEGLDVVALSRNSKGFLLDMSNTRSSGKCGAGAELPTYVALALTATQCSVTLTRNH